MDCKDDFYMQVTGWFCLGKEMYLQKLGRNHYALKMHLHKISTSITFMSSTDLIFNQINYMIY